MRTDLVKRKTVKALMNNISTPNSRIKKIETKIAVLRSPYCRVRVSDSVSGSLLAPA